uniref:Uncharacterized protein n=1 Tax=Romanomermis culicivorax TaxID=13658 RepID=A0A915KU93_ROMCU
MIMSATTIIAIFEIFCLTVNQAVHFQLQFSQCEDKVRHNDSAKSCGGCYWGGLDHHGSNGIMSPMRHCFCQYGANCKNGHPRFCNVLNMC